MEGMVRLAATWMVHSESTLCERLGQEYQLCRATNFMYGRGLFKRVPYNSITGDGENSLQTSPSHSHHTQPLPPRSSAHPIPPHMMACVLASYYTEYVSEARMQAITW